MHNNQEDKTPSLQKLEAERGFYILTNLAFIALNCFLLSNAYGLWVGIGLSVILGIMQKFLILRIYNLKRSISMVKMIDLWVKLIDKEVKKDDKDESNKEKV